MRLSALPVVLALGSLWAFPGATARGQDVLAPTTGKGVVFVADGAGNFHIPSATLQTAVGQSGVAMSVERFGWAQGGFRPLRDLLNHDNHLAQGAMLAARVEAYRCANPGDRIVLVGHSTGAAVVLAAAELLPPGSVDRIVLLAAAVSRRYDLGAAKASTREGVDSFHSFRDGILSTFVMAFGTADRRWQPAGGWLGFRGQSDDGMLRQHRWSLAQIRGGNFGGHFGTTSARFLRSAVVPLVAPTDVGAQAFVTATPVVASATPAVSTPVASTEGAPVVTGSVPLVSDGAPLIQDEAIPTQARPGLRGRIAAVVRR